MKRGTPRHPKVRRLAKALGVHRFAAVGILECLWHFAAEFNHNGDISAVEPEELAEALFWDDDPKELLPALILSGWVDGQEDGQNLLHDWPHHCEGSVHKWLYRRSLKFADGTMPSNSGLSIEQKRSAERAYKSQDQSETYRGPVLDQSKTSLGPTVDHIAKAKAKALAKASANAIASAKAKPKPSETPEADSDFHKALLSLDNLIGELSSEKLLVRILDLTGSRGTPFEGWWGTVLGLLDSNGLIELSEYLHTAEMPERERAAKGETEVKTPGGFIASKILEYARTQTRQGNSLKLPSPPKRR